MTPALALQFSAATDGRQLTVDEDCTLLKVTAGCGASVIIAVVSKNPATTIANSITAPATTADENIIAISRAIEVNPNFPLYAGQSVFVSVSGACSVVLSFQLNR